MIDFNPWYVVWGVIVFVVGEIGRYLTKRWLEQHGNTLYKLLSRKLIPVVLDIAGIAYFVYIAIRLFWSTAPATKLDVLIGVGITIVLLMSASNLFNDLRSWARSLREESEKQVASAGGAS